MFRKDLIALSLAAVIACGAVTPAMAMESGAEAVTIEMAEMAVEAEEKADGPGNEEAEDMTTAAEETQKAEPEEDTEDAFTADQPAETEDGGDLDPAEPAEEADPEEAPDESSDESLEEYPDDLPYGESFPDDEQPEDGEAGIG